MKTGDRKQAAEGAPRGVGAYLGYGLTWALSTILFLLLGQQADRWLETEPVFTLIGAFVGAGAGFYYMYRQLMSGGAAGGGGAKRGE